MSGPSFSPEGDAVLVEAPPSAALKPDYVLLDDDPLIHLMWQVSSAERGKNVLFFSNATDFFSILPNLHPETPVYIDANLGNGVRGEDIIVSVVAQGFSRVFLATGYSGDTFPSLPQGVVVVGKEPPWESTGFPL